MPPSRSNGRRPARRQQPTSCDFCRRRKLRCDQQKPCSNCQSRHIECQYSHSSPPRRRSSRRRQASGLATAYAERSLVNPSLDPAPQHDSGAPVLPPNVTPTRNAQTFSHTQRLGPKNDLQWLRDTGTFRNPSFTTLTHVQVISSSEFSLRNKVQHPQALTYLPPRHLAEQLLIEYFENIDPIQHLIHVPSTVILFESLYSSADLGEPVSPGHVALVLSICATAAWFRSASGLLHISSTEASSCTHLMHCWLEYVWAVFESARQVEFEGVEIVQAMCIIHLLCNKLEGFSFRVRHLHAGTVLLARRKGLHMTDAGNSGTEKESSEQLELEMRRRVWWYIVATDWTMAASDGPGEGAYSIHPHQQAVKMPRNINDDDLNTQSREFERPSTELTSMTCFLIRLRVSEVCRDIVDLQWASRLSGLAQYSNHHRVHLIDKKILEIIHNLPPELGLDQGDIPEMQQQPVTIHMQRLLLNSMIYARRCKLHLPFLFNTQQDTRSAPLRLICLSAARNVVDIFSEMWHQGSKLSVGHMLHCGCLDFLYFATVVLLADFCLNVSDEERHTLRGKIETAVKVLQRARVKSSMVEMYLASLSSIARRHNIHLPQPIVSQPVAPQDLLIQQATLVPESVSQMLPPTGSSVDNDPAMLYETNDDSSQFLSYFRGLDDMDWDVLLSDIDNFIH